MDTETIDFELSEYINNNFIEDKAILIHDALNLVYLFKEVDSEHEYVDLLNRYSNTDNSNIQDELIIKLNDQLDILIEAHKLFIIPTHDLRVKVQLLNALQLLMHLEDYSYVLIVLETELSDIEKISRIISEYCLLNEQDVLELVTTVDPIFIKLLQQYALSKEGVVILELDESNHIVIENLKLLKKIYKKDDLIGIQLLKSNIKPNLEIGLYLTLLNDQYDFNNKSDIEELSLNIFSLLLLTRSNLNGILHLYKKNSHLLLNNSNTISLVEVGVMQCLSEFLDYKKMLIGIKND